MGDDHVDGLPILAAGLNQIGIDNDVIPADKFGRKGIEQTATLHDIGIGDGAQPQSLAGIDQAGIQSGQLGC